jgi:formylglycine-generating enzyme required for sulfatase activity
VEDILINIVITFIVGLIVGLALLWVEYAYFRPLLFPLHTPTPVVAKRTWIAGTTFLDPLKKGHHGPEMVVIPAGRFQMGDLLGNGYSDEQPVHWVFMDSFAMGRYEVTFAEYDRFAEATGRDKPDDQGWGRGKRPVINVSWNEAIAYTEWLKTQTGHIYRLPTEAEWEYAARAVTLSQYWWGEQLDLNRANCDRCGSPWDNRKTAPVGSFAANYFKLHDLSGNVYEWTCSEYEEKYNGKEQLCSNKHDTRHLRVIRGGSWYSLPKYIRVSSRFKSLPEQRDMTIGFRIVTIYNANSSNLNFATPDSAAFSFPKEALSLSNNDMI